MSLYNSQVIAKNPVYYFKGDESAWPVINSGSADLTSHLTQVKSFSFNPGTGGVCKSGWLQAITTDYSWFKHNDTTTVFDTGVFTINAWVSVAAGTGTRTIFKTAGTTSGNKTMSLSWVAGTNDVIEFTYGTVGGSTSTLNSGSLGTTYRNDSKWHQITVTANGTAWAMYFDGVLKSSGTYSSITGLDSYTKHWGGPTDTVGNDAFVGALDELSVFPTALTATDASNLYRYGNNGLIGQIGSYAMERYINFDQAYSLTPTRGGTNSLGTFSLNGSSPSYTVGSLYAPTGGGLGSWKIAATSQFSSTGGAEIAGISSTDTDYTDGAWIMLTSLPGGTSDRAVTFFQISGSGANSGFALAMTGSTHATNPSKFSFIGGPQASGTANIYGSTVQVNRWYYLAIKRSGSGTNNYTAYIDGQQVGQFTYASTGNPTYFRIGDNGNTQLFYIAAVHHSPTSVVGASQILDIYGAGHPIDIDISEPPMEVTTSELIYPSLSFGIDYIQTSMDAFAEMSSVELYVERSNEFTASVMAVEAYLHMPEAHIGEDNLVTVFEASAELVEPSLISIRTIYGNAMVGTDAELVTPTIETTFNSTYNAQPMNAVKAFMPIPPDFINLFDDKWYELLYAQQSTRHRSDLKAGAFLKLFNDTRSDIKLSDVASTRKLEVNLSSEIVTNGVLIGEDPVYVYANSNSNWYNPTDNPGQLTIGTYDAQNRPAVKFNNIQFDLGETNEGSIGFVTEFSIKTTKSNQIIMEGKDYTNASSKFRTSYGLNDGKLYFWTAAFQSYPPDLHPKNYAAVKATPHVSLSDLPMVTGFKRIDDGQWHHIVIQSGWDDGRIQIWIDGDLDIQKIGAGMAIQPAFMGYNTNNATYASDFETSAWSYDADMFISDYDIDMHNFAYTKYEPIKAEPMIASATSPAATARGNRGRMLMLYWWPQGGWIAGNRYNQIEQHFDSKTYSNDYFDEQTFDEFLTTDDLYQSPPQAYYGWDVYPVDVTGKYVSELVNIEAYGGEDNIFAPDGYRRTRNGFFRDIVTDTERYINLQEDIDLNQFEVIAFKNFPDQTVEQEWFTKDQFVDSFFNIREKKIYEDFIKSLRDALNTGISLYITNHQLAIDLGIIDRVERVPSLVDVTGTDSDIYNPTLYPGNPQDLLVDKGLGTYWADTHWNNRIRVVNIVEGMTDMSGYIFYDSAYWFNSSENEFGGTDRPFAKILYKENGLQIGDEFLLSDYNIKVFDTLGVPFENIKAGKPVTAYANYYRKGLDLVENPYKDYATSIVLEPGDTLGGSQIRSKVYVNFVERMGYNTRTGSVSREVGSVDLITDYWINRAYADGLINLAKRDELIALPSNLDRRLASGDLTLELYNKLTYWSSNGMYILGSPTLIEDTYGMGTSKDGLGNKVRISEGLKYNSKSGKITNVPVYSSQQWFSFSYSWQHPRATFTLMNTLNNAWLWMSQRSEVPGTLVGGPVSIGSATLPMPVIEAQHDNEISAQAMISSGTLPVPYGVISDTIEIAALPMNATAEFGQYEIQFHAAPLTASAKIAESFRILTSATDEVVLYIHHVDPILYLREDVIK